MTFDYAALGGLASGLLKQFGQGVITLEQTRKGAGPSYEPGAGSTVYIPLDGVGKGVAEYFKRMALADASEMKFTTAVIAGVEPSIVTDWIILGGTLAADRSAITGGIRYKVTEWNPVPNRNVPLVWKFTVKKG
jgi:hypothetical protein